MEGLRNFVCKVQVKKLKKKLNLSLCLCKNIYLEMFAMEFMSIYLLLLMICIFVSLNVQYIACYWILDLDRPKCWHILLRKAKLKLKLINKKREKKKGKNDSNKWNKQEI